MTGLQRQSAVGSAERLDALEAFYQIVNTVVCVTLIGSVLADASSQQAKVGFKRANLYFDRADADAQIEHYIQHLVELGRIVGSNMNWLNGHCQIIAEGWRGVRIEFELDELSIEAGVRRRGLQRTKSISRGKPFCEPLNASIESIDRKLLTDKLGFKPINL